MDWSKQCLDFRSFAYVVKTYRSMQLVVALTGIGLLCAMMSLMLGYIGLNVAIIAIALLSTAGIAAGLLIYKDARYWCSMVPVFEKPIGGIDTFNAGIAIAYNMVNLEILATAKDARMLDDFHSLTAPGEEPKWCDAAEGLNTIRAMIEGLATEQYVPKKVRTAIESDLRRWEVALERAAERGIRFAVFSRFDYSPDVGNGAFGSVN